MGKGFHCSAFKGSDLGDLITEACQRLVCMIDAKGRKRLTVLESQHTS